MLGPTAFIAEMSLVDGLRYVAVFLVLELGSQFYLRGAGNHFDLEHLSTI